MHIWAKLETEDISGCTMQLDGLDLDSVRDKMPENHMRILNKKKGMEEPRK